MTTVRITSVQGQFLDLSAGCLCILGKNPNYAESLRFQCNNKLEHGYVLDTLTFLKTGIDHKILNDREKQVADRLIGMLPFMRTMVSTEGNMPVFNIKDFTRNEVMHAMFHYRTIFTGLGSSRILKHLSSFAGVVYTFMDHYNLPFWKAYMLACTPTALSPAYSCTEGNNALRIASRLYNNDANLYDYSQSCLEVFVDFLSGKPPVDNYIGDTFQEEIPKESSYPQNVSLYLKPLRLHQSKRMDRFWNDIAREMARTCKGVKGTEDLWGDTITEAQVYETVEDWILCFDTVFDKYTKEHNINTEDLMQ